MPIAKVSFKDPAAPAAFAESLRETGFGVLTAHPIDMTLVQAVFDEWADFFAKAATEKLAYLYNKKTFAGYVPPSSETAKGATVPDNKEFFSFYPFGVLPQGMSDNTLKLYQQMTQLASTLLDWAEAHMPAVLAQKLSQPLGQMIQASPRTVLRILHYPPLTGGEQPGAVRSAAHEDINLLTILPAATTAGLEVKNKAGDWIQVPCDPGCLIINTGDMLSECTEGFYQATTHRVTNPVGSLATQSRYSMPLFLHPRDEIVLSNRHTALTYFEERLKELGIL